MPALKTARIMWFALLNSTVIFLVILIVVKPVPPEPPEPILLAVFAVAALGVAAASFVVPAMSFRQAAHRVAIASKEETVADASRQGSDVIPYREAQTVTRRVAADPERARRSAMTTFMAPFIVSMAMPEAVTLLGFVTGFLGFPLTYAIPFFVLGWVLMLTRFPTEERVLAPLERIKGIHIPRA